MSKRSVYTTITPLPTGVTRQTVLETLHLHTEMIDLNPLVEERHPIKPPPKASPEEFHCQWYELTDKIQYLPGGLYSGKVSYTACFHDLANGVQTHIYAPMGLEIRGKWTIGGSLPGEPQPPVEMGIGIPMSGLYLREDTDLKCNYFLTNFVKKNLKNSHAALVARLVVKAQLYEASMANDRMSEMTSVSAHSSPHLSYAHHSGSIHGRSPLASPSFPPSNQGSIYPDPLTLRSQSPFNPTLPGQSRQPYPPQYDPRFSMQSSSGSQGSPGYGVDPSYAASNPYAQLPQQHRHYQQGPPQQMYGQYTDGRQSNQPSELASYESASETQSQKDPKRGVDVAGPPPYPTPQPASVHQAPIELPAELQ